MRSHNQVLEAWNRGARQNVFSLDYHTDTKKAFLDYAYWRADSEFKAGKVNNPIRRTNDLMEEKIHQFLNDAIDLDQVNDNLRHDEHLDFAVRTDLIEKAFVVAKNSNPASSNPNVYIFDGPGQYDDHRLIEYNTPLFDCSGSQTPQECRMAMADSAIEAEVLSHAVSSAQMLAPDFFENYILDIDCDYFNTEKSLTPGDNGTFRQLVRESEFITIALEPECVGICLLEGNDLDSDSILESLLTLIESA